MVFSRIVHRVSKSFNQQRAGEPGNEAVTVHNEIEDIDSNVRLQKEFLSMPPTADDTEDFISRACHGLLSSGNFTKSNEGVRNHILKEISTATPTSRRVSGITDASWIRDIDAAPHNRATTLDGQLSSDDIFKIISLNKPAVLRGKRIYIQKYGYGYVQKTYKNIGRPTVFEVSFNNKTVKGILKLNLSRREGQRGEFFVVCSADR